MFQIAMCKLADKFQILETELRFRDSEVSSSVQCPAPAPWHKPGDGRNILSAPKSERASKLTGSEFLSHKMS